MDQEAGVIRLVESVASPVAVVRLRTRFSAWPGQVMPTLDKVYAFLKTGAARQQGHNIMIYRPLGGDLVAVECGVQVAAEFAGNGEVVCSQLPAGMAATTTHVGPYHQLRASHKAVEDWCRANGRKLAGLCWEIYGDWNEDEARLETDVFHLTWL